MSVRFLSRTVIVLSLFFTISLTGCFGSDDDSSGPDPDKTAPTVVGTYPADAATNVSRTGPFWIAFSEPMDEESVENNISGSGSSSFDYYWSDASDTLFFAATYLLTANTTYNVVVGGDAEDLAANTMGNDFSLSFTTTLDVDMTPPTVVSVSPANTATGIDPGEALEIIFSEPIHQFHGWDVEYYMVITPLPDEGYFTYEGNSVFIYHTPFPPETVVNIELTTGIADLSGNNLAAPYNFSFTTMTDDVRPYLASAAPSNRETGVSIGLETINLTFSESMEPDMYMPEENVDARIYYLFAGEPDWSENYTVLDISLNNSLLPGCTYWVYFEGATDMAGNLIDPDPTHYYFSTAGETSYYPIEYYYTWYYGEEHLPPVSTSKASIGPEFDVLRRLMNFNMPTGDFEEFIQRYDGTIEEKTFLRLTGNTVYHVGRAEYNEGVMAGTMVWDDPMPYVKLPVPDHAGESWPVSATMTVGEQVVLSISGTCEIESRTVTVSAPYMEGVFRECYVHHLRITVQMYEGGVLSGTDEVHQIMYLAEGVGPVMMTEVDDEYTFGNRTISVVYWTFMAVGADK
ncbi:MAG: Ig-like domain-containing protein [Candidatus Krumholzibacteria bacterium]|nr:Ig-like domain-containing protein [Candidatus Krumholzibacteria bacterium]